MTRFFSGPTYHLHHLYRPAPGLYPPNPKKLLKKSRHATGPRTCARRNPRRRPMTQEPWLPRGPRRIPGLNMCQDLENFERRPPPPAPPLSPSVLTHPASLAAAGHAALRRPASATRLLCRVGPPLHAVRGRASRVPAGRRHLRPLLYPLQPLPAGPAHTAVQPASPPSRQQPQLLPGCPC